MSTVAHLIVCEKSWTLKEGLNCGCFKEIKFINFITTRRRNGYWNVWGRLKALAKLFNARMLEFYIFLPFLRYCSWKFWNICWKYSNIICILILKIMLVGYNVAKATLTSGKSSFFQAMRQRSKKVVKIYLQHDANATVLLLKNLCLGL